MIPALRRLSPTEAGAHYFFGYYDVPAYNSDSTLHLAHRVGFWERRPAADDVAQIGILERGKTGFTPLATTTAWNFQQGAMLQWFPGEPSREIIFNVCEEGAYRSCILEIHSGKKRLYPMPIANVDRQGRYALSINFSRMYDFRPGYGYAGTTDPWQNQLQPAEDGIYLQDFQDGSVKLILSLEQIGELTSHWLPVSNRKLLVNHLTFNPSGTRFVALVRYFPEPGQPFPARTVVLTANTDGSDCKAVTQGYTVASHYFWKNDAELLIYVAGRQGVRLYEWNLHTGAEKVLDADFFTDDGHCSYSSDRRYVLYDSYPDEQQYRHLYLYDLETRQKFCPGKLFCAPSDVEIRCDLHPRWNPTGELVSLDSTHEGGRGIYEIEAAVMRAT